MEKEKMKILKMLEEKKINSNEAAELFEALEESKIPEKERGEKSGKVLKIRVYEDNLSKPKVDLSIPLSWGRFLVPGIKKKIGEKMREKGFDFDIESAFGAIEKGSSGKIVDIEDGNNKVQIYIE